MHTDDNQILIVLAPRISNGVGGWTIPKRPGKLTYFCIEVEWVHLLDKDNFGQNFLT